MNRWLLTALMLLTLTGSAMAQGQQVQNMGTYYRNPQSGAVTDSSGNQLTSESFKDRDLWLNSTAITDSFNIGGCDSSGTTNIYTAPYGRLFIKLKVTPATALVWARFDITVSAADSVVQDTTTTLPFVPVGEGGSSDSVAVGGHITLPGGVGNASWEFPITLMQGQSAAAKWGEPFGAYFEIKGPGGLPYWAPYTKIKIRYATANPANSATALSYKLKLIGRPF